MCLDYGYSVDVELIPHTITGEECPNNGNYRVFKVNENSTELHTCLCEDHCSWDMCNLAIAPKGCLEKIPSSWHWDDRKNTWVAQIVLGNTFSIVKMK